MKTPKFWQQRTLWSYLFLPLALLYRGIASLDRSIKLKKIQTLPRPVIVVGNINLGGTGKTPVTITLVNRFKARGFNVGVLSRGYGRKTDALLIAETHHSAIDLGDEPYLIYQKTGVPLAVHRNRYEAGIALLKQHPEIDLFICDDGLQHHILHRDIEIGVVGKQGFGNELGFPAGPLREPISRLKKVDFIINNSGNLDLKKHDFTPPQFTLQSVLNEVINLKTGEAKPLSHWQNQGVSAIAGIAYPEHFFAMLRDHNIDVMGYGFPDHHHFTKKDLAALDTPLFMTEKDAVKCQDLALDLDNAWKVPLETTLSEALIDAILKTLNIDVKPNSKTHV